MRISKVKINNFKSLKKVDIDLSNLTLITGVNSSGKSSFIQTLLLIQENIIMIQAFPIATERIDNEQLIATGFTTLKCDKYKLGNKNKILHHDSYGENITFDVSGDNSNFLKMSMDSKLLINSLDEKDLIRVFIDSFFYYLNTDRISPANDFLYSEESVSKGDIGLNGEYTAHYLAENRHQKLAVNDLKHLDSETDQLLENTYKWLGEISSGVSISASADPSTQSAKITYQYEYGNNTSSEYSPLSVGFGLTYVLPVIVLILKSKPGDLIIIENPESHLHPAGQSKIAELCAIAAHNGVQIIVESHSDHFLNGLRVATKKGKIKPEESKIYYFRKEKDGLSTIADTINIDKEGKLDDWPANFFDEWDNQLNKLLW